MFKLMTSIALALAGGMSSVNASHLDNIDGIFDSFSFDEVKFKTRTNCSLDKYPEVSRSWRKLIDQAKIWHECLFTFLDPHLAGHRRSTVYQDPHLGNLRWHVATWIVQKRLTNWHRSRAQIWQRRTKRAARGDGPAQRLKDELGKNKRLKETR